MLRRKHARLGEAGRNLSQHLPNAQRARVWAWNVDPRPSRKAFVRKPSNDERFSGSEQQLNYFGVPLNLAPLDEPHPK